MLTMIRQKIRLSDTYQCQLGDILFLAQVQKYVFQ